LKFAFIPQEILSSVST